MGVNAAKHYREEEFNKTLYYRLAAREKDEKVKKVLEKLAEDEERHAAFWKSQAGNVREGFSIIEKVKLWLFIIMRYVLGLTITLKLSEMGEEEAVLKYSEIVEQVKDKEGLKRVIEDEEVHENMLIGLLVNAGKIKDAVYASSDALIEVLAAVSGLAGVFSSPLYIGFGGVIVGVSGMMSMTIGAYLSSKSEEDIRKASKKLGKEVNEVNSELDSQGSSEESAKTTAYSYILASTVPVIPFLAGAGGLLGLSLSYAITAIATFAMGSIIGILGSVNPIRRGSLMAGLAIGAALATHAIGLLLHASIGI
ncbi:MAG: VIT1/CCC1 family protein [Caldisphaeraceae archaeon]|nr:VIT1/CCC1 family protein [Caldisphaeraceae archaeon]